MKKCIKIHVRVKNSQNSIWGIENNELYYKSKSKKSTFSCFENIIIEKTNLEIYNTYVKSTIEKFKNGTNATVFAYGQTGSGKTHTIIGNEEAGIVKLALEDLLESKIKLSFIEIFNEKIYDLATAKELKLFSKDDKAIVFGLTSTEINSKEDAFTFIDKCTDNRKIGETKYNSKSSRSHAILTIKKGNSVLNFIDLAGSEKSSNDAKRMQEASFINRSLLALGTVVNRLLNDQILGFRDSKLTRILQESMTNDSIMLAFCMINPYEHCLSESISTLNFAARLMSVDIKIKDEVDENKLNKTVNIQECIDEIACKDKEIYYLNEKINFLESFICNLLVKNKTNTYDELLDEAEKIYGSLYYSMKQKDFINVTKNSEFLEKIKKLKFLTEYIDEPTDGTDLILNYIDET